MDNITKVFDIFYPHPSVDKEPETSPDSQPPPNPDSTDPAAPIPFKILAFRSIITMLSGIQQQESFRYKDPPRSDSAQARQQLGILNALSNVAVTEHAVVAVMLQGGPYSESIEVKFSAGTSEIEDQPIESQQDINEPEDQLFESQQDDEDSEPQSFGFMRKIRNYWSRPTTSTTQTTYTVTQNPRKEEIKPENLIATNLPPSIPSICTPSVPVEKSNPDGVLRHYINMCWGTISLNDHLWVLGRLLTPNKKKPLHEFYEDLVFYVIAACHKKMLRRMKHPTLSKPFVKTLNSDKVKETTIKDTFDEQPSHTSNSDERAHDIKFLETLLIAVKLQDLEPKIKAPDLCALGQVLEANTDHPFQLYTKETCHEFRDLLTAAILNFQAFLTKLTLLRKSDDSQFSQADANALKKCIYAIFTLGTLLQNIAKGSAIVPYFKHIESILRESQTNHTQTSEAPSEFEFESPDDVDLRAVHPFAINEAGVLRPLWKSYRDWFRLILTHFEAVNILFAYVIKHPDPPINIRLVTMPQCLVLDDQLLPWKEVLADAKLFPTSALDNSRLPTKSNVEIIDFITNSICVVPEKPPRGQDWIYKDMTDTLLRKICRRLATNVIAPSTTTQDAVAYPFKETSATILEKILPGVPTFQPEILQKITEGKSFPCSITRIDDKTIKDVNKLLRRLDAITKYFNDIKEMDGNFSGSLHCEACLASLTVPSVKYADEKIFTEMADHERVIGVSKRCCPVCYHLLSLLQLEASEREPFLVKGSHNTISPCTLPIWLPERIVDDMNTKFGIQLRSELVKLMDCSDGWRKRVTSSGSGGPSSFDSFKGQHIPVKPRIYEDISMDFGDFNSPL